MSQTSRNTKPKEWTGKKKSFSPHHFLLFTLLPSRRSQSKAAIPPTTPAPTTPIMDKPTRLAPPNLVLLEDAPVGDAAPSVSGWAFRPAQSELYESRTLWPTAWRSAEGLWLTIQLIQVWIPLRLVVVHTHAKVVQAPTESKLEEHWLWHGPGNKLGS